MMRQLKPRNQARLEDQAVWSWFAQHVTPLRGRKPVPLTQLPAPPPNPAKSAPLPPPTPRPPAPRTAALRINDHPPGVDSSTYNRFRAGKLAAARTLDLHGRTAQRAFHALTQFLQTAQADRLRCVEIITGRGQGETGGILRRELPLWLNLPNIRPLILAAAHPHTANLGSVRLLLRRTK